MITNKEISRNVKKYRKMKGYTQAQLAELVDISTIHMSHIETGSVSMSLDCLLKICDALDISPNHILLPDFAVPLDNSLLQEKMQFLTNDEKKFIMQMIEALDSLCINR
ncbi:helix-turn-helix transcriptional regulator [Blautia schinkii]|nr:helix-turn-helix transcriptional regulator [Blautia schinkii]